VGYVRRGARGEEVMDGGVEMSMRGNGGGRGGVKEWKGVVGWGLRWRSWRGNGLRQGE